VRSEPFQPCAKDQYVLVEVEHVEDSRTRDANQGVPRKWRGYTKLAAGSGAHEGGTTNTEGERLQILKRKGRLLA
jgi:hypothetical protein